MFYLQKKNLILSKNIKQLSVYIHTQYLKQIIIIIIGPRLASTKHSLPTFEAEPEIHSEDPRKITIKEITIAAIEIFFFIFSCFQM